MDCCGERIKGNISTEMVETLQALRNNLDKLVKNIKDLFTLILFFDFKLAESESSQKNLSEMLFMSKMTPTVPLTDYYMERIELRKIIKS